MRICEQTYASGKVEINSSAGNYIYSLMLQFFIMHHNFSMYRRRKLIKCRLL